MHFFFLYFLLGCGQRCTVRGAVCVRNVCGCPPNSFATVEGVSECVPQPPPLLHSLITVHESSTTDNEGIALSFKEFTFSVHFAHAWLPYFSSHPHFLYRVWDAGDVRAPLFQDDTLLLPGRGGQSTYTHRYTRAGGYTVTFEVLDMFGRRASGNLSVVVQL